MPTARLVRTTRFFALHHLRRPDWSDERNRAAFGPLSDPAGHGHDYRVTVRVSGPVQYGMVVDLALLDRLLAEIVGPLAGRHLNVDVPEFAGERLPTCESIAQYVYERLHPRLPGEVALDWVRVAEDDTLAGEVGPG